MKNPDWYFYLGATCWLILLVFAYTKYLNKLRFIIPNLIFSLVLALYGFLNFNDPSIQLKNGSAAAFLFLPIFYLVFYIILRKIYLVLFADEPLMTAPYMWSWNSGEHRKHNFPDAIFTILTVMLPLLMVYFFSGISAL